MSKIIRLTEIQLLKIVKNIVKEQNKGQIMEFGAIPTVSTKSPLSCIDPKLFTQKSADGKMFLVYDDKKLTQDSVARRVVLYSDGSGDLITGGQHNIGKWSCGNNGVEFRPNSDPKMISYLAVPSASAPQPKKTVFVANEKLPLKFGQKGENIKMLQSQLGVTPQTGQFWTKTEMAIKATAPEYKRAEGVPDAIWKKIFPQGNRKPEQAVSLPKTNVPSDLTKAPTNLPSGVSAVPSIQPAG